MPNFEMKKVLENSSNDVLQADFPGVFASDEINYFIRFHCLIAAK